MMIAWAGRELDNGLWLVTQELVDGEFRSWTELRAAVIQQEDAAVGRVRI